MWPVLLDMTKEESMQHLRCLEIDAYSSLVSALRAQGALDNEKLKLLKETGSLLHISQERHKAEIRRVVNDEKLNTIAYHVNGEKHSSDEWAEEGQRLIPLMARVAPQTAYSAIADEVADTASKLNKQLPSPACTERKRPPPVSPTPSNASTSDCGKNLQFRMSEPDLKKRKLSLSVENSNLAQHLMGPPKISKIQQIYRQKTKARQKEHTLMKLKQDLDKPEYVHIQQVTKVPQSSPKVQSKLAVSPKINILQNISIQTAPVIPVDEIKVENDPEVPQPSCSVDNKKVVTAPLNKLNQVTIKTTIGSDVQKTIKVCAPRKAITSKTVTTSSGQKLIVVSNPQSLTTTSILQRTLTTIPFKNISVKNFDKFKIVTSSSSPPIQIQNAKQKVVTVRTAANKKMIPFSQMQVLNKGCFKVLPFGGKIISKTNTGTGVYFMNTTSGEGSSTKSTTSTPVLMSSKMQDESLEEVEVKVKLEEEDGEQVPEQEESKEGILESNEIVSAITTTEGDLEIKEELEEEEEELVKLENNLNSFYIVDGENATTELLDGLQPLQVLEQYSKADSEQENGSPLPLVETESHVVETESPEVTGDLSVMN